ncbi:hypothetical protein [Clostridium sp. JS66]|uniref:hypothetical protein n=1 Tax=Clostridium sp. JS66 TaxID=3064705 RepID=UPI00298D6506|nr:hypothetical protein [Clostridium sp. JS66]WPC39412.1 hypothetical protein Q6H37_15980 [Clostridium sp. JS66]
MKIFINPFNPCKQTNNKVRGLEYTTEGIPLCPLTKVEFKSEGPCKDKNRSLRFKFTCLKSFGDKKVNAIIHAKMLVQMTKVAV